MFEALRGRRPTLIDMDTYRRSSVVVPLIQTEEGFDVLFEVRAIGLKHQPGEICFPGGGCEQGEEAGEAAVREICEELHLNKNQIEIIAPMDVFVSPFNMIIYPYLGILNGYEGSFNSDEVLEVFRVPLKYFMDVVPKTYYNKVYTQAPEDFPWHKVQGGQKYRWNYGNYPIHFYEYGSRTIWGITARIMKNTVQQLKTAGWRSE